MSIVTTRPDATIVSGGSVTGAGSHHAAYADDSDSSYVALGYGDISEVEFADPTIPAGAIAKYVRLWAKVARFGVDMIVQWDLDNPDQAAATGVNWISGTTISVMAPSVTSPPTNVRVEVYHLYDASLQIYELYLDTIVVAKPVVDVIAPTGTVAENLPLVEWESTLDPEGLSQTGFQVKIFSAAQYGAGGFNPASSTATYDSGVILGFVQGSAVSWNPSALLANGTYRAYVRVSQHVNDAEHWSDWAYEQFIVDAPVPADPTLTLTPENETGRIKIELAEGEGGDADTDFFAIERSLDGGTTWEPVRTLLTGGLVAMASPVAYDYELPNNYESADGDQGAYRARAVYSPGGASSTAGRTYSGWVSDEVTWLSNQQWLKHPTRPSLNMPVTIYSLPARKSEARQGVMQPLGRTDPVIVSDTRTLDTGTVSFLVDGAEDREALTAILGDNVALLLQTPPQGNWPETYLFLGDRDSTRGIDKGFTTLTIESFSWTEVAAPDGNVDAWPA